MNNRMSLVRDRVPNSPAKAALASKTKGGIAGDDLEGGIFERGLFDFAYKHEQNFSGQCLNAVPRFGYSDAPRYPSGLRVTWGQGAVQIPNLRFCLTLS